MSDVVFLRNKKNSQRIKPRWILFLVFVFFVVFIGYLQISANIVKTFEPKWETVYKEIGAEVVFIRDEKTINASVSGQLELENLLEAERIRVGQMIATVYPQGLDSKNDFVRVTSKLAGVLSYKTDGLEEVLIPKSLSEFNLQEIKNIRVTEKKPAQDFVEQGEVLFRVINSFKDINIIVFFPRKYLLQYEIEPIDLKNETLWIVQNDMHYKVQFLEFELEEDNIFYMGKILEKKENFYDQRKEKYKLVFDKKEGFLIPNSALVTLEQQAGLYLRRNADYEWVAVELIEVIDEKSLVNFNSNQCPVVINPEVLQQKKGL